MARLVIGNRVNGPYLKDISPESLWHTGAQGQRLVWCARPGDVLVLALAPDPGFLAYATGMLGFAGSGLDVVVPPEGKLGPAVLTRDRFTGDAVLDGLRRLVRERRLDSVEPFYFDGYVNQLARGLGLAGGTPGFAFVDQGGHELLNSKAVFRAVAAGTGLPIPEGVVTSSPEDAVDFCWDLLRSGRPVIVKQDRNVAGLGNEILSRTAEIDPLGAAHHEIVTGRAALAGHIAARWPWYTNDSLYPVVIEEYLAGSVPIWGEVAISDRSTDIFGYGKVRMRPICAGVIIPVPDAPPAFADFLVHLEALAVTMRSMGYRGLTNIDAVLTPDGRVLFNEFNARYGGSTHLFAIGERVIGGDYLRDRCIVERRECGYPAFGPALRALTGSGLAYDPRTRTGVIISVYGTRMDGTGGEACIVGENLAAAEELERELAELFPSDAP
ncbi:peptide ligase PGM1-related protein [Actinophytocola sp.]|uniref:preATP grasp domain-containing protein n=1 Tax=Actinophytocola sp. TaxID=1872138 RepID=UPI002D8074B3|nr:peptide ligase PGM1-related protein [Actinophytocola sp.]HET9142779.1 peptide ligase PGM1-related protein [Actinophytocola sp.]